MNQKKHKNSRHLVWCWPFHTDGTKVIPGSLCQMWGQSILLRTDCNIPEAASPLRLGVVCKKQNKHLAHCTSTREAPQNLQTAFGLEGTCIHPQSSPSLSHMSSVTNPTVVAHHLVSWVLVSLRTARRVVFPPRLQSFLCSSSTLGGYATYGTHKIAQHIDSHALHGSPSIAHSLRVR